MKTRYLVILLVTVTGLALGWEDKKRAKESRPRGLPAEAEQVEPNMWRHTDADGKTWIYRRTPFGLNRYEEKVEDSDQQPEAVGASGIRVTGDGEVIRFERDGPFGAYRWTRKKSELTPEERAAWEKSRTEKQKQPDKKPAQPAQQK